MSDNSFTGLGVSVMTEQAPATKSRIDSASLALFLTGAGLIVTVATLDRAAPWKAGALLAGAIAVGLILIGAHRVQWRLPARIAAGFCLVAGAMLLVIAPAPAEPEPQPKLVVSKFEALPADVDSGAKFDVTLHNTGARGAVLNELVVKVTDFAYLPACFTAGSIQASKPYPLTMPDDPPAGSEVRATLHEEVPAGRVDRFLVDIGQPPYRKDKENGLPITATFVYLADVSVTTDVSDPVALGNVAFSTPSLPSNNVDVWDLSDPARDQVDWLQDFLNEPGVRGCLDRNSAALDDLLDQPAEVTQHGLVPEGAQD